MNRQHARSTAVRTINVGIYGCTHAGKTQFLFQLLRYWQQTRQVELSETAKRFLADREREIKLYQRPIATAAATEGIAVTVLKESDGLWPNELLTLVFRDLRGELLSDELDKLDKGSSIVREGVIPKQVRECDAFLFFFDPTSSENPDDIDRHHERELRRAEVFIKYVHQVRQNRLLPVVFVLTHLDQWEHNDDICRRAGCWFEKVHAKLQQVHKLLHLREFPASLTDPERICFQVSSVREREEALLQLDATVKQLLSLCRDAEKYVRSLRESGRRAVLASVATLAIVVALALSFWFADTPSSPDDEQVPIAETPEEVVLDRLEDLRNVLARHPRDGRLPNMEDAKQVNDHLRWLVLRLAATPGENDALSPDTLTSMRKALDEIGALVLRKLNPSGHSAARVLPVLATYLQDLPDLSSISPELAQAQDAYWEVYRKAVLEQLSEILERRRAVGSAPFDTLDEVIQTLRNIEKEVHESRVFGTRKKDTLLKDIRNALTFCEDRKKYGTYSVSFRVENARHESDEPKWRSLTIKSPGQRSPDFGLKPENNGPGVAYRTKQESYQLTLGLGSPVTCEVSVLDVDGRRKASAPAAEVWRTEWKKHLTANPSPLDPLGLPLLSGAEGGFKLHLEEEGMVMDLIFVAKVPPLLWEAATRVQEQES